MSVTIKELVAAADTLLEPWRFHDYCPNGLQVEGRDGVEKLVSGVTACQAFLDEAVAQNADAVLVHHGYFWKGEEPTLVGIRKRRITTLLENNISLLVYHLPLDAHTSLGNNAQLALKLGIETEGLLDPLDETKPGNTGSFPDPLAAGDLVARIADNLCRQPLHIAGNDRPIKRIAWCTGAAQSCIEDAIAQGVDAYLTGEASEQTVHLAREAGIHFFAAGHHATERYGVQAVGNHLADKLGIAHQFIDIDNPV
jgi:dinuclear metal center YbgI/SA1388 family protein